MGTSATTHLAAIDAAIAAISAGRVSGYSIQGRSATYQDLGTLFDIRDRLLAEIERDSGTQNSFSVAKMGRTSQ